MIDGAPQIHLLGGDADDHLVQVPPVARARPALPQPTREHRAEFQYPPPYRLIGEIEAVLGEQILHIAIAQHEPEVQRYSQIACWMIGTGKRCRR